MIFHNGITGSLGHYFGSVLEQNKVQATTLLSRLENYENLRRELDSAKGHIVPRSRVVLVQMAAMVPVPSCEENPDKAYKTNVADTLATIRVFVEWAEVNRFDPLVLFISTGHVYKATQQKKPILEEDSIGPRSVYAKSKLEAETELKELSDRLGFFARIARIFGLVAPRQPAHYVLPSIIRRVQEENLSGIPGLSFYRDYLDSRDVCQILLKLCRSSRSPLNSSYDIVNVCSGREVSIRNIVEEVIQALKPREEVRLRSTMTEAPGRSDDVPWIVGSSTKLKNVIGFDPQRITLAQTIRDAIREFAK